MTSLFLLALVTKGRYLNTVVRTGWKGPPVYKMLEQTHQTCIVKAKKQVIHLRDQRADKALFVGAKCNLTAKQEAQPGYFNY